jgi:hypothetical protein
MNKDEIIPLTLEESLTSEIKSSNYHLLKIENVQTWCIRRFWRAREQYLASFYSLLGTTVTFLMQRIKEKGFLLFSFLEERGRQFHSCYYYTCGCMIIMIIINAIIAGSCRSRAKITNATILILIITSLFVATFCRGLVKGSH